MLSVTMLQKKGLAFRRHCERDLSQLPRCPPILPHSLLKCVARSKRTHQTPFRSLHHSSRLLLELLQLRLPGGRLEGRVAILDRPLPLGLGGVNLGLPRLVRVVKRD